MMIVMIDDIRYVPRLPDPEGIRPFGELLVAFRKLNKMSLDRAAKLSGISKTYLHELETGAATDPSLFIALRISEVYGIDLKVLAVSIKEAKEASQ